MARSPRRADSDTKQVLLGLQVKAAEAADWADWSVTAALGNLLLPAVRYHRWIARPRLHLGDMAPGVFFTCCGLTNITSKSSIKSHKRASQ